ncbi:MAG TPA: hypothetical protein VGB30_03870 [bacterium]
MIRYFVCITSLALIISCSSKLDVRQVDDTGDSVEIIETDWSNVTSEDVWIETSSRYEVIGPGFALWYLDQAIEQGIVTDTEANQIRAGFLYELGRYNDAFMALVNYSIDESRPDLLRLRADLLTGMNRYEDAARDYERLVAIKDFDDKGNVQSILYQLYDSLGEWDKRDEVYTAMGDPSEIMMENLPLFQVDYYHAIIAGDPDEMKSMAELIAAATGTQAEQSPIVATAYAKASMWAGNYEGAVTLARGFMRDIGFDINLATILLSCQIELNDRENFATDLNYSLEQVKGVEWYTTPETGSPPLSEDPINLSKILTLAGVYHLGYGEIGQAGLCLSRAALLDPYSSSAMIGVSGVQLCNGELQDAIWSLEDAYESSSLTGIRPRLRMLQFSAYADQDTDIGWDNDTVLSELQTVLDRRLAEFPDEIFYRAAMAEIYAYKGDYNSALNIANEISGEPGAGRDIILRKGFYQAMLGMKSDAVATFKSALDNGAPYIPWFVMMETEASAKNNPELNEIAENIRQTVDPGWNQNPFFSHQE